LKPGGTTRSVVPSPRFSRLDLAILAVTALAAALVVAACEAGDLLEVGPRIRDATAWPPWDRWTRIIAFRAHRTLLEYRIALAIAGPGVALAAFRRPGALDRRSWQRPGVLALAAATVVEVIDLGPDLLLVAYVGVTQPLSVSLNPQAASTRIVLMDSLRNVINFNPDPAGVVLGSWAVLALSGAWRPSREWRDRAGRCLGWGWLLAYGFRIVDPMIWGLPYQ